MKRNLIFAAVLIIIFAGLYQLNKNRPVRFEWVETFDSLDKQPYGTYVLDEILRQSWPEGYTCNIKGICEMYHSGELNNKNLFIICSSFNLWEEEVETLFEYIEGGGKALVATYDLEYLLGDTLDIRIDYSYGYTDGLPHQEPSAGLYSAGDSIKGIPRSMLWFYFSKYRSNENTRYQGEVYSVFRTARNHPVMLRYPVGKGELILCSTPTLFTNYSVLDDSINLFIRQSLSLLEGKPLVRTEYYEKEFYDGESQSVFRYLFSREPLRWAFYIALTTIGLLFIFSARRKQNIIPVVKPPANTTLTFVQTVASLYLRKNNNADIIRKKYIYWADKIRQQYGMDIINEKHDLTFYQRFAEKTGMEEGAVRHLFIELDRINESTFVSDQEMIEIIKKMHI